MALIFWRGDDETKDTAVTEGHPLPVHDLSQDSPVVTTDVVVVASNATAYGANDTVGRVMSWNLGRSGVIETVVLTEDSDTPQNAACELYLFNANIATLDTTADNAAWDPGDGVWNFSIGSVPITAYPTAVAANGGAATARGVGIAFTSADGRVYGRLVTSGTPTYGFGGLRLRLSAVVR